MPYGELPKHLRDRVPLPAGRSLDEHVHSLRAEAIRSAFRELGRVLRGEL
jgi:hypothetical protein